MLKTDAEGAACVDSGLTASKLEQSIENLRTRIVALGHSGPVDCNTASSRLAAAVKTEDDAIHALHADLAQLDGRAFNQDFEHAAFIAGREGRLLAPVVRACA